MCDKAALLKFLCPKKTVKEVIVDAEFNDKDIGIDRYRKSIERKLKVLKTRQIAKLNSEDVINIDDTELGRKRRRNIMDDAAAAITAAAQLSNEQQQQLKALLPNNNSS